MDHFTLALKMSVLSLFAGSNLLAAGVAGAALSLFAYTKINERMYTDRAAARLNTTYGYILGGLGISGLTATALCGTPFAYRILTMNPWVFFGTSLISTIPLLFGTMSLDYEKNHLAKNACWAGLCAGIGASMCTIGFLGPAIIAPAAVATAGIVGGLSCVAAFSDPSTFTPYRSILGVGLGGLVGVGLASLAFPASQFLYNLHLYGGLVVFSGLLVADTQKIVRDCNTKISYDPINSSLSVYLDTMNIFVKMVQIMSDSKKINKKKD